MVANTSIMAHRDAELEGGGDHLIGLKLQIGCLRALMEFAKNDLISYRVLLAQTIYQVLVLAVQPVVPSLIYRLAQHSVTSLFLLTQFKIRSRAMRWQPDSCGRIDSCVT